MLPVWFFVGVLLALYGLMILASGVAEWSHPPDTVLAELHAPVWWGALMAVVGFVYVAATWPRERLD